MTMKGAFVDTTNPLCADVDISAADLWADIEAAMIQPLQPGEVTRRMVAERQHVSEDRSSRMLEDAVAAGRLYRVWRIHHGTKVWAYGKVAT